MTIALLYSTFPDRETASEAAKQLVEEHLAACCNVIPGMEATYWWEGSVQQHGEVVMFVKTSPALASLAISRLAALHPYENPAILQLPVTSGAADYLAWVNRTVLPADSAS